MHSYPDCESDKAGRGGADTSAAGAGACVPKPEPCDLLLERDRSEDFDGVLLRLGGTAGGGSGGSGSISQSTCGKVGEIGGSSPPGSVSTRIQSESLGEKDTLCLDPREPRDERLRSVDIFS